MSKFDVRTYGAVGDGVTPDGTAIQAAATALMAAGGGVLYFPAGNYLCNRAGGLVSPYDLTNKDIAHNYSVLISGSNIEIQGEGNHSVLKQADPYTTPLWIKLPDNEPAGNITVRELKFAGDTYPNVIAAEADANASTGGSGVGALLAISGTQANPGRNISVLNSLFEDGNKTSPLNLAWLDNVVILGCSFIHFKDYFQLTTVRAATVESNGNISLSTPPASLSIDGVVTPTYAAWQPGDRVMLRNQTAPAENGVYLVTPTSLVRAEDADTGPKLESILALVIQGVVNRGKVFFCPTTQGTFGATAFAFKSPSRVRLIDNNTLAAISTAAGLRNVNNVATSTGDRVLLASGLQPTKGLYVVDSGAAWQLASDANTSDKKDVLLAVASEGDANPGNSNAGRSFALRNLGVDVFSEASPTLPAAPVMWAPVVAASTINMPITPISALIDGNVTLLVNDRVLLKDQTQKKENGIYLFKGVGQPMTRALDAISERDFKDLRVVIPGYQDPATSNPSNARRLYRARLSVVPADLPFAINVSPIYFDRCDALNFSVKAATTAPLSSPPSGTPPLTIDTIYLVAGDRILVKNQATAAENGVYVVSTGTWQRAPDLGAGQVFDDLQVLVASPAGTAPTNGGKLFSAQPGGTYKESINPGNASVYSGNEKLGTMRLENNYFDGDARWMGRSTRGCTGMILCRQASNLILEGNTLNSFKLAGIQPHAQRVAINGNNFRTTKRLNTTAVNLSPDTTYFTEFSAEITGNNCDGAQLLDTANLTANVFLDLAITGNNVILYPAFGLGGIRIVRGRRVSIQSNLIDSPSSFGIQASSAGITDAVLSVIGNTISRFAAVSGGLNRAVDVANITSSDRFFGQTVFANNTLSALASGGKHIVARKPPTGVVAQMHLFDNAYVDESNGVMLPAIDVSTTGGSGSYDVKGFFGRQFWSPTVPAADPTKYSLGDVVWNSSPTRDAKSPIGFFHVTSGKHIPLFGAGMGFSVYGVINTSTAITPVTLLAGLPGQRYRVLEVGFVFLQNPTLGTAGTALMIRSSGGTPRLISSLQATNFVLGTAGNCRVDDGLLNYISPAASYGLGALHDDGQGVDVVGINSTTNAQATLTNLSGNFNVLAYISGVLEYV